MRAYLSYLWVALGAASMLSACGGAEFGGKSGKGASADANPGSGGNGSSDNDPGDGDASSDNYKSIGWLWRCAQSGGVIPDPIPDEPVLVGAGEHKLDGKRVDGVPMKFFGGICEPSLQPRDIVFVIDISSSMRDNDPVRSQAGGTTCGRRSAVEQVIRSMSAGSGAQFAIVTFSSVSARAGRTSSGFFSDSAALFADIAGTGDVGAVLCANNGNTEYTDGLTRARSLFERGRANANPELYFVSDGNPNTGYDGQQIAANLKNPGVNVNGFTKPVIIATVMIGSESGATLRDKIASIGPDGQPLFARSSAEQLSAVLAGLAANKIIGGELRYRALVTGSGNTNWTRIPLMDHLQGYEFTLPSFNIEVVNTPAGIDVEFEYWDQRDRRFLSQGRLMWE